MKHLLLAILYLTVFKVSYAQHIEVSEVKNEDLIYVLNNLKVLNEHVNGKADSYVKLYKVTNPSGSAGNESCEVSSNIYIAVSEDGEEPEHHLFKIKDLIDPQFIQWSTLPYDNEFILSFLDKLGDKKKIKIKVELSKLEVTPLK